MRLKSLVSLLAIGIVCWPVNSSQAANSCPALPRATFAETLMNLLGRSSSPGDNLRNAGDPIKMLNSSQHDQVLEWMRQELTTAHAAVVKTLEKSEARKKAEDLKRRIFTRDRMERDKASVTSRIFDRAADGSAVLASGKGKPLGQLIDEEIKRTKPSLIEAYKAKYARAIYDAIKANPSAMGEIAGALSAGDYYTVVDHGADLGALSFATIVSDVLKEKKMVNAKVIWDRGVKHAGAAKRVLLALKNGGSGSDAMKIITEELKAEGKAQTRDLMKAAINFAFSANNYDFNSTLTTMNNLGGVAGIGGFAGKVNKAGKTSRFGDLSKGAATIGDFLPSKMAQDLFASKMAALTPGDIYLKLVDAEFALIEWGTNYLRTSWTHGDGPCIDKYKEEYARTTNVADAYEAFDGCIVNAKFSAMFEFGNQAQEMDIDKGLALKEFLEANRRGLPHASTPVGWIAAKARQIAAQRRTIGQAIEPQLAEMNKEMSEVAQIAGALTDARLNELAGSLLDDKQWDGLSAQLLELEKKLDETLAAIDGDLNHIASLSHRIANYCSRYEQNKLMARQALEVGGNLSARTSNLRMRLELMDTSACELPAPDTTASDNAAKSARLAASVARDSAALNAAVESVCAAPEEIRKAKNKAEARAHLDDALATAREAQIVARELTAGAGEIAGLKASDSAAQPPPSSALAIAARAKVQSRLAAIRSELDGIVGEFGSARGRFTVAHSAMADAQKHVFDLQQPVKVSIDDIKTCLQPLAASPAGERPRTILAGLLTRNSSNIGCNALIQESWTKEDIDPPRGDGAPRNMAPWQSRSMILSPPPDALRGVIARIDAKCPAGAAVPALPETAAQSPTLDPDAIRSTTSEAIARMERCAAEALVAFNEAWLKPKPVAALTCQPQQNADILAKLRDDGSDAAREQIARLEPIAAAVSQAQAAYANAQQAYNAGKMDDARADLGRARTALDGIGNGVDCIALAGKVATGMSRVERLDSIMSEVSGAIGRCDSTEVARLKDRYASISHLMLTSLFTKGETITHASAAFERARASFAAGDLSAAESTTRRALASLNGTSCAELRERLTNALSRIDQLRTAINNAEQAVTACKVEGIERWRAALEEVSNPAASGVKQRLIQALSTCRDREKNEKIADLDNRCKLQIGTNAHIDPATAMSASPMCLCNSGYVLDKILAVCVQRPKTIADGHPVCQTEFGTKAYAMAVNPNSTYKCGCSGGYVMRDRKCRPPTWADGHRACQTQVHVRSRATSYAGNGRWNCTTPQEVRRPPPVHRPPGQRQPTAAGQYICTSVSYSIMGVASTSTFPSPYPVAGSNCRRVR